MNNQSRSASWRELKVTFLLLENLPAKLSQREKKTLAGEIFRVCQQKSFDLDIVRYPKEKTYKMMLLFWNQATLLFVGS